MALKTKNLTLLSNNSGGNNQYQYSRTVLDHSLFSTLTTKMWALNSFYSDFSNDVVWIKRSKAFLVLDELDFIKINDIFKTVFTI